MAGTPGEEGVAACAAGDAAGIGAASCALANEIPVRRQKVRTIARLVISDLRVKKEPGSRASSNEQNAKLGMGRSDIGFQPADVSRKDSAPSSG